jgi:DNA replication protein DnaC
MDKKESAKAKLAQLKSQIIGQRTTREPVRLPTSTNEAIEWIEAAVQAEIELRRRTYEDVPELHEHIKKIAELFTSPTYKFGIMLCGGVGNGKSTMMKALQSLLIQLDIRITHNTSFETLGMKIISAKELGRQIRVDPKNSLRYQELTMLGIDDLGEEEATMMDYGNRVTPVIDLLSYRYDQMLFTMVTTNLTPKQIRSTYGDRIADRFNEMMRVIIFTNPSYRGQN